MRIDNRTHIYKDFENLICISGSKQEINNFVKEKGYRNYVEIHSIKDIPNPRTSFKRLREVTVYILKSTTDELKISLMYRKGVERIFETESYL